jgi:LPS export ABC transporter protein LptC
VSARSARASARGRGAPSLLLPLALLLGACNSLEGDPIGEDIPEMAADQVIYGLHHEITVDGVNEAVVDADSAYMFEDSTSIHLFALELRVYDENGGERAHVVSRTGRMDTRTQAMVASGDAVVETGTRTIRTESLHYDPAADRVWSDVPFQMVQAGRTTTGSGFNSDAEFRNLRVTDAAATGVQIEF